MAKISSTFFQARADDAAEEVKMATLAGAKERFEQSRTAWQGLADQATERKAETAAVAAVKATRETDE